jgi:hypothetical protein
MLYQCLIIVLLGILFVSIDCQPVCRFAVNYENNDLLNNVTKQQEFIKSVVYWEGQFIQPFPCQSNNPSLNTTGYDNSTGMTLDGHRLTVENGLPLSAEGSAHLFTASSKECIHVALLARVLYGDPNAAIWLSPNHPTQAVNIAIEQLQAKINTYDLFNIRYPGFGMFIPWVNVRNGIIDPTQGFNTSTPALDNGQLMWAVYALVSALRKNYPNVLHKPMDKKYYTYYADDALFESDTTLLYRYELLQQRYIDNAIPVFYDGQGRFRAVTMIKDIHAPYVTKDNYYTIPNCGDPCYLDDPYEGELFTVYAYLFSDWSSTGDDRNSLWLFKRKKLQSIQLNLPSSGGSITAQKGWWFSGHELWKLLFLPYADVEIAKRVFLNGERARTYYSYINNITGLFASVTGAATSDSANVPYLGASGIAELAFQPVQQTTVVTPYAAFPLILLDRGMGLVWYKNMIAAGKGQNCFGSTEGLNITGYDISPFVTWDTKQTTVAAMLGGAVDIVRNQMQLDNVYEPFVNVINREMSRVFTQLNGEDLPFKFPQPFPEQPGWDSCTTTSNVCLCK